MRFVLRRAFSTLSIAWIARQGGLALLVVLLCAAWLRIPDSNVGAVAATILLACLIAALAFVGEASLLRQLAGVPPSRKQLLRGAASLLAAGLLWLALATLIDHLTANDSLRAGYLNSRLPHSLRNIFSFQHLLRGLGWLWMLLRWSGVGVLIAAVVGFAQARRGGRALAHVLGSASYWVVLLIGCALATSFPAALLQWVPGRTLGVEAISLALRLIIVFAAGLALACYVLAVATTLASEKDQLHPMPLGTPEASQPRASDIP